MALKEHISGTEFTEMLLCAAEGLDAEKQIINELNVFPVPDGDTGTNMALTMGNAAAELRKKDYDSISDAADKAASALLRGARGNSGVILSLLFRGISKVLKGQDSADAADLAAAMREGVEGAYRAVMKPAEGTILTVSRVASAAAMEMAQAGGDIEAVLDAALSAGEDALARTTEQNPVLKRAGVVDAGGMGYVVILRSMLASLRGEMVSGTVKAADGETGESRHATDVFDTSEITFAYDTVFIVSRGGNDKPLELLRAYLDSIGDSLVISEGDEEFKVHVHTNIPGAALTEAAKYGTLETAKIENMRTQHDELLEQHGQEQSGEAPEPEIAAAEKKFGFVSVCAGEGMAELFRELGADRIVTGGQTMNPSTEDILREVNLTPAEVVFVLPNNKNIIMAAEQCAPLTETKVIVIPTRTVPQGVTAMLNAEPYAEEEEIVSTLTEAIGAVHTAQITYAARDSEFDGYSIKSGEYLGLLDGALCGSFTDINELFDSLSEKMQALSPEFLSIYYGSDVSEDEANAACARLAAAFPDSEVSLVNGGQPVYYYLISAE